MPKTHIDDTLDMYYEEYDFADPWREHETVVLHPGNMKDHRLWYAWVPLLAQRYRVVTLDARGHGLSTIPSPGYGWSMSGFAHDLRGLLDNLGIQRAHLIGETTGGPITLQFAHEFPERVITLTQCSAFFKPNPAGPTADAYLTIQRLGLEGWARANMDRRVASGSADDGFAAWYSGVMLSQKQHVAEETLRYLGQTDISEILPTIRHPTLILTAEHNATRSAWSEPMHALMPGSELVVIPGTHGFVQHTAPRLCVEAWEAFISRHAQATGAR